MKRGFVFLVTMLFVAGLVSAAGGGGGGGGSSGGSGGSGSSGPIFTKPVCDTTGKITFTKKPTDKGVILVTRPDESTFEAEGEWDGFTFTSEEALFNDSGIYTIKVDSEEELFSCPGYVFSCRNVALKVHECVKEGMKVQVKFSFSDDKDELKYLFQRGDKTLSYQKNGVVSEGLESLLVTGENGEFQVDVNSLDGASQVEISFPECVGRYYVYSRMSCANRGELQKELSGKELKCGGYLSIQDRVKCRLDLREKEEYERENFFPEECKARNDTEECLRVYQAVQECWDFPNNASRTNCVKRVLKLGDILTEKANCNALDAGKRENCNQELKDKVYALVKFRLYNLEEEAERLMEEGKISKEQVVDFVVKMENYKLSFNLAKSKEERKLVLMQARKDWVELVRSFREEQ